MLSTQEFTKKIEKMLRESPTSAVRDEAIVQIAIALTSIATSLESMSKKQDKPTYVK